MSDCSEKYLLGKALIQAGGSGSEPLPMSITYYPWVTGYSLDRSAKPKHHISVSIGRTRRDASGPFLPPDEMLLFRKGYALYDYTISPPVYKGWIKEESGWFERKCAEAGCAWFVPMVKRMAAGETVPIEEIQAAYRGHNGGREMPVGTEHTDFQNWSETPATPPPLPPPAR